MVSGQTKTEVTYNPSSLINLFNVEPVDFAEDDLLKVKGVYLPGKGLHSEDIYYDYIKDEASDAWMTFAVPVLVRTGLKQGDIIEFRAYLSKKVQLGGGRINFQLHLVELLSNNSATGPAPELTTLEILEKRAQIARKDVDNFIRNRISNGQPVTINIMISKSWNVDQEIKAKLPQAPGVYKVHFLKVNFGSVKDIIQNLHHYQRKCDVIAIAEGNGESSETFDRPEIAEAALVLTAYFITALGNKENGPLLQKVADKSFITPTAFVEYLNDIYNNETRKFEDTKARLIETATIELERNYINQIQNLQERIAFLEANRQKAGLLTGQLRALEQEKATLADEVQDLQRQVKKAGRITVTTILLIIIALLTGVAIGGLVM